MGSSLLASQRPRRIDAGSPRGVVADRHSGSDQSRAGVPLLPIEAFEEIEEARVGERTADPFKPAGAGFIRAPDVQPPNWSLTLPALKNGDSWAVSRPRTGQQRHLTCNGVLFAGLHEQGSRAVP